MRDAGYQRSRGAPPGSQSARDPEPRSEEPPDRPVLVDVHAQGRRLPPEPRHPHDIPRDHDEESGARARANPPDLEDPARGCPPEALVVRDRELRLRDAHREAVEPRVPETLEVLERDRVVLHLARPVDLRGDLGHLLLERVLVPVDGAELARAAPGRPHHARCPGLAPPPPPRA